MKINYVLVFLQNIDFQICVVLDFQVFFIFYFLVN